MDTRLQMTCSHHANLSTLCKSRIKSARKIISWKYRPDFPDRFAGHDHELDFCRGFFRWHNEEHCHWGIGLLTPAVVHTGRATAAIEARASVLATAHARHPERLVQGVPRPLTPAAKVWINPPENRPRARTLELPSNTKFFRSCLKVIDTFRVIPATGRRFGCNMISAISNFDRLWLMVFSCRFNADVFIRFLARLQKSSDGRKIILIVDSHPAHKAAKVARWIEAKGERRTMLELCFMPGYSPEIYPDELHNQDTKQAMRKQRPRDQSQMIANAR